MTDPQIDSVISDHNSTSIIGTNESIINTQDTNSKDAVIQHADIKSDAKSNSQIDSVNKKVNEESSLTVKVLKTIGSGVLHAAISSIGRKAIVTTTLYMAGGALISAVGLGPVITASAVVLLL